MNTQVNRSELKNIVWEVLKENKIFLKEILHEMIEEQEASLKEISREENVKNLVMEDLVKYRKVWEALS